MIVQQLYGRTLGHEQILGMFEDLTVTTSLPSSIVRQESFVLPLFAELATRLLHLALALLKYPHAPEKKHSRFIEFEAEHMKAVQRIKSWAERLNCMPSSRATVVNPVPLPSQEIPVSVNKYFHGRQKNVQFIHDQLRSSIECPAVVCVHGLPGMGKTQLAAQYCKLFGAEYFACIWITADSHAKVGSGLSNYAVKMKLEGTSMEAEPRRNAQSLVSWLQTTDKPWLVIFDNVDEVRHLEDFWPAGGSGHIVITSRSPYVSDFQGAVSYELPSLSQNESTELFYKICGEARKKQHSRKMEEVLAEWKGVPLALYHIGSYISRTHLDLSRFMMLYQQSAAKIHQAKYCTDGYPHSIATAFSIGELEGDMKAVLRALCYFDPDGIPNELLQSNFDHVQPLIQVSNEFDLYDALAGLCRAGLISQTDDHVTVHRLVQAVAFSDMSREVQITTFDQALTLLNGRFPRQIEGKPMWEDWDRCKRYLPHVMFICRRSHELFNEGRKDPELASLLSACTWYMVERGLFSDAEPLIMTAQLACPDTEEALLTLSAVLFNLAGVRFECNRIKESLELCKRVLEIRERLLDPIDPLLGNTLFSIGIVYMEAGYFQESLQSNLRAVKIHEACQKCGKHDGSPTALSYLDLGLCYWKMGELGLASTYVEKGLALFEKTSGKLSQKYGQGLSYLALVREGQKRLSDAKEASQASLEICEAITPHEFKTGLGMHKMATILQKEGNLTQALDYIQRALPILESNFESTPMVARSMFRMSEILADMGRGDEAVEKRAEAVRLRSTITAFSYDSGITSEAFDTLVPSFLC
ncbi:TPR-like protein [Hypoxylon sp. FL1150]|nr:TPR-like protein [Hypoxylon sp. FL1150]